MTDMTTSLLLLVVAAFAVAGFVKGATGMGLPAVAMALLASQISPVVAAGLLVIPSLVTNVWQLLTGPDVRVLLRRLWPMMIVMAVVTYATSGLIAGDNTAATTTALGVALVVYAAYTLCARQIHIPAGVERLLSPVIGAMTGVVTGATGVFMIPSVPYLQALGLTKDWLVQALGLSFTVSTLALAVGLAGRGALASDQLLLSCALIVPVFIGMAVGTVLRRRFSPALFRQAFLICLLALGAEMALRPLW